MKMTREEINEMHKLSDTVQANGMGIGLCGCGKCGVVYFGMRDRDNKLLSVFHMHWTEVEAFCKDVMAEAVKAAHGESRGNAN